MNQRDWQRAYEPDHQRLEYRVASTLAHLDEAKPRARRTLRTVVLIMVLLLALCGVGYAVYEGLDLFARFYGTGMMQELQNGDLAIMGQSKQLGDVVYTIEEVIYKKDGDFTGLYTTIRIRPAPQSNVVLIPSDTSVDEAAGYAPRLDAELSIADDAPSYAELAQERKAKILMARASVHEIAVNGNICPGSFGELWIAQPDGSLVGVIEMSDDVPRAEQYDLVLNLSNWEVTLDNDHLQEEPNNTWLRDEWHVTIKPVMKEEEQ